MQSNRGFTLIELMIVVAIIALAASIAVPQYNSYVQKTIVSNGVQFAIEPQIEIAERIRSGRELPNSNHSFHQNKNADAEVEEVWWFSNKKFPGHIVINYGPGAGSEIEGKRLWIVLDASNPLRVKWTCMSHPSARLAIPINALPKKCR